MKHENLNYLIVGSFVLVMLIGFLAVAILITGRSGETDSYIAYYDNIAGIKFGTAVSYEGFQIGQVDDVVPLQDGGTTRYRLTLAIRSGWKIPHDSVAKIVSSGLLSAVAIDIKEGGSTIALRPGDEIPGEEGGNIFAAVGDTAGDLSLLISDVRAAVRSITDKADNQVPGILAEIQTLVAKLNSSADTLNQFANESNQRNVTGFLQNMNSASADFVRASANITKLTDDVGLTLSQVRGLVAESNALLDRNKDEVETALQNLSAALQVVAEHINAVAYNMESTSRNMNEFSRQIRENPGLLLGSRPPPDRAAQPAR